MKSVIYTEGSKTVTDSTDVSPIRYFKGSFLSVARLAESLDELGETNTYILSENYGFIRGDETEAITGPRDIDYDEELEYLEASFLSSIESSDIVVLLFTTEVFDRIVAKNWDSVVNSARSDSLWCFGASRSSLKSIDIGELEENADEVLTYQRVGVARIGTETKNKLLEKAEKRAVKKNR